MHTPTTPYEVVASAINTFSTSWILSTAAYSTNDGICELTYTTSAHVDSSPLELTKLTDHVNAHLKRAFGPDAFDPVEINYVIKNNGLSERPAFILGYRNKSEDTFNPKIPCCGTPRRLILFILFLIVDALITFVFIRRVQSSSPVGPSDL